MTRLYRTLAAGTIAAGMALLTPASASATVLGFDDIADFGALPLNYGGLDWTASSWLAFDDSPGDVFTPHSGNWQIAADFGSADADTTIRFGSASIFDGAWFSGYADSSVSFKLYLGGALVGTSATLATSATSTFLGSSYAGLVDAVVVASGQQAFYAMDDLTFHAAVPVPEPETWALLVAGLGVVTLAIRRRKA